MAGDFFRRYLPDPRLAAGYKNIIDAAAVYRAARRPDVAARLEEQLASLFASITRQTEQDAIGGTEVMRRTLKARLVRDRTQGPHLADRIVALPTPLGLPAGGIGYGAIEQLDQAVDPDHPQAGTYWRAIEEGSSHMVGRIVLGYFQPGFVPAAADQFRRHPYFTAQDPAEPGFMPGVATAPAMRVQRPIEAKHFLQDGSAVAIAAHEQQMKRLQRDAIDAMLATVGTVRTP